MSVLPEFSTAKLTDSPNADNIDFPLTEEEPKMEQNHFVSNALWAVAAAVAGIGAGITIASATEPCGDFGECKALIEINSSDGDIGFHFLMDGDDLNSARIHDPNGNKVFEDFAKGPLRDQKLTETFAESAEPPCFDPFPEDEDFVTLEEFLDRWAEGTYTFSGSSDGGEKSEGETELTYEIPAAPVDLDYDDSTGVISWDEGDDLGECATKAELTALVTDGVLLVHPEDVDVVSWEIVFSPDVAGVSFSVRVPGDIATKAVTIPADFLAALPANTPAKMEVGAIGVEDNATYTEEGDLCVNEAAGC